MKAFLLKYRSSLLLFAVMFLFGWGSAAVVAKWQSDRETEVGRFPERCERRCQ